MASNGGAAERRRQIVRGPDQRQTDKPEQSHPRAEARCRRQDRVQERREARTRGHQGRQLVSDTRVGGPPRITSPRCLAMILKGGIGTVHPGNLEFRISKLFQIHDGNVYGLELFRVKDFVILQIADPRVCDEVESPPKPPALQTSAAASTLSSSCRSSLPTFSSSALSGTSHSFSPRLATKPPTPWSPNLAATRRQPSAAKSLSIPSRTSAASPGAWS